MSNEVTITQNHIENRIFTIRGMQVMLDFHLSELFVVETKRLNEQVKRNIKRFPLSFMFQLTASEWKNLQSQIATTKRRTLPFVFTEQGVAMLSAVLNSNTAINVSIQIMDAFVKMRQIVLKNTLINYRLDKIEIKQLETEQKFEKVFKALESKNEISNQGVFFDGQVIKNATKGLSPKIFVARLNNNLRRGVALKS